MSSRNNEAHGVSIYSNQTYLASSGRTIDKDHVFNSKHKDEKTKTSAAPVAMSDWERRRYQQMKQRKRSSSVQRPNHQTEKTKGLRGKALQSIDPNSPKRPSNTSPKRTVNHSKIVVHNDQIEVTPIKPPTGDRVFRSEDNPYKDRVSRLEPTKEMNNSMIDSSKSMQVPSMKAVNHQNTTKTAKNDVKQEGKREALNERDQIKSKIGTVSIIDVQLDDNYRDFFDYLKKEVSSNNGDVSEDRFYFAFY